MADPGEILQQRVSELLDIAAGIPGGITGMIAADDDAVIALIESAQLVVQSAQGILAAGAGEVARRSSGSGDRSLARRLGWRSARGVLAAKAGISFGDAGRLVAVGEAIRPNGTAEQPLPADRPHVASAVLGGELILPVAQLIDRTLEQLSTLMEPALLAELEGALVRDFGSGRFSVAEFTAKCAELVDRYRPASAKDRDDALRRKAHVSETWLQNGMLRITADLDPEAAAFYRTAISARTNPRRAGASAGNVTDLGAHRAAKQPTAAEARLSAFISIMRDSIKRDTGDQAGVDTTILVRIDLDKLLTGIGHATIDGISTPISAAAARRLAAEANIIPQVMNGKSQVLDQGEAKREFTKAQRYAILADHDRCAFPGCDIPSWMLEFHHIDGWARRREHEQATDLQNGMPLCGFHNRLMEDGWDIRYDDAHVPWLTPPAVLDPSRTPIRGSSLSDRRAA